MRGSQPRNMPQSGGYYGELMNRHEFFTQKQHRKQLTHLHFCCAAFYFIVLMSVFLPGHITNMFTYLLGVQKFLNLFSNEWIDYILVVGLALAIQLTKSRIACSLLFAYTAVDCLYKYYVFRRIEGVWPLLVAGYMVTLAFEMQKAWSQYQQTGIV
ncbi:MAG: hypothetical protein K5739_09835 [Lachnospiraceae bacterium]|nr:hypothetical protein [Lachnospiraceae bacterium]